MSATGPDSRSTNASPGSDDRITASDDPAAPEVTRYARRAEAPPPQYWRRWDGDAPVDDAADNEAAGEALANSPAADTESTLLRDKPIASAASPAIADDPYRILIVEDDPSQAMFAEGVLRGTGMETMIVAESSGVIDALERFHPDLVLMDLHIPGLDGIAMTEQIRAHEEYLHTPIVFLTGDPDPDRQFEVLAGGADDFLNKPIRPRHLVAAVQSRVQRARKLGESRMRTGPSPETGLLPRAVLIERLAGMLRQPAATGALLFVEIAGSSRLREHYGYAAYEHFMAGAGLRFAELIGDAALARLDDKAFLVLSPTLAPAQIGDFARTLR
ncbi:MAG: response regulator, partial [Pseudomonadota bacterium]|nr:response regulator [Pseudomonadota bacterium]